MSNLGLHAYHVSAILAQRDYPFYALIAAAMRKADSDNAEKLRLAFPDECRELQERYNAPLGVLPEDRVADMDALRDSLSELRRKLGARPYLTTGGK